MAQKTHSVLIVGAGIGGLSASIHLASRGYKVRLLEQQPSIGGKLNRLCVDGFTFDTGPSLITMPFVLRDLFHSAGRRLEDYLQLVPLDPTCRYFYRDGVVLNAWRDPQRLAAEFSLLHPSDGQALHRFLTYAGRMYAAAADPFLYHSLGSPFDLLRSFATFIAGAGQPPPELPPDVVPHNLWERLRALLAALSPSTLDQCARQFFQDAHLRQLFARYATYNGSSPYKVASVYSIIPYVEMTFGGWYSHDGIYALALALGKLAAELGVDIHTNSPVRRILVERGRARGVVLADNRVLRADLVVANSDVVTTHRELLPPAHKQRVRRLERLEPSCSGFVLLLGLNKRYPHLAHHNIFFSQNYPAEFRDLFELRQPIHDPTIYVCASTRTDPTQAPPACENLFVLVNAPYLTPSLDWSQTAHTYRDHVLDRLLSYKEAQLADLREHIISETILTPQDFYARYGSNRGSIYGLSSNARLAPFTRPGNRSHIRGLYFVGGSTHPGGGVPLVILSGKIVADLLENDTSGR